MKNRKLSILLLFVLILSIAQQPTFAMQGGSDATGDTRVVALVFGQNTRASCSGVPLAPLIVVAAAHCLSNSNYVYSSETYVPNGLSVATPGTDLTKDSVSQRSSVARVALTPGFTDKSFSDDIAFYFLNSPLNGATYLPIARLDDLAAIKKNGDAITHIGYGYIAPNKVEDYKPHLISLKSSPFSSSRFGYFSPSEEATISSDETPGNALCVHDSGGPFISRVGGIEKLLAINLRADGCDRNGVSAPVTGTLGLSPVPYMDLLQRQWNLFAKERVGNPGVAESSLTLETIVSSLRVAVIPTPSPTPTVIPEPGPSATASIKKMITILCSKGKTIQKISGSKPVCPKGFVKVIVKK
jgi:hypothetical protein